MAAASTIFASAFASGGGTSRYGDFVVVRMQNTSFVTTPMELQQVSTWARGRMSSGMPQRDRTVFVERFETIIGRIGSAVATRGSRGVLSRIVKSMKANALMASEWNIPHDLDVSMEIKRKPAPKADGSTEPGTPPVPTS
jgi:hypothetical protein